MGFLLFARPAAAQNVNAVEAQPDSVDFELSPIEVLVSIAPRAAPSVGSGVPARISSLTSEDVQGWQPRLVADLLAGQAGVSLYDDLGSPYKLNLSARGFNVGPTLGLPPGISVFLDGTRQNEPSAQEVNFDLLPMEHVERVEFLRGNASLLGPNSLGGAVNLITRRGRGERRGAVELSAGSFGMTEAAADASGRLFDEWDYYAGGGYEEEGGWREATGGKRFNGLFNIGRAGEESGLRLQGLWSDSRAETAGSLPEGILALDPRVNFTAGDFEALELQQITVSGFHSVFGGRGSLTGFFRRTDAERFNVNQPSEGDVRSFAENRTLGGTGDWRRTLSFGESLLSVRTGFDLATSWTRFLIYEEPTDGNGQELTTEVESPRLDLAGYAMVDLETDRTLLSAGARIDFARIPFEDILDPAADTISRFTRLSPRAGISVDVGRGVLVFGSVGLSFRAPAILELACADPEDACPLPFALGDDPPLDPVTATNYEIGAGWTDRGVDVSASLYRTDVNDEIFFVPSEASIVQGFFRNLGKTRREGIEVEAALTAESGLHAYVNYAYTRATFQSTEAIFSARAGDEALGSELSGDNVARPGDRLPMIPANQIKLGGTYGHRSGLTVGLDGRFFGEQWFRGDEANEVAPLGAYFSVGARSALRFGQWEIEGIVHNLFSTEDPIFGTFNFNQSSGTLERFLTPLGARALRVSLRRTFGSES